MRLSNLFRSRSARPEVSVSATEAAAPAATGPPVSSGELDAVEQLVAEGRIEQAIDRLTDLYHRSGDEAAAIRLVDLRHSATGHHHPEPREPWPPEDPDPFPDLVGTLPEVKAADLDATTLGGAVRHHGALILRGLFDADRVAATVDLVDRVNRTREQTGKDGNSPDPGWFRPFHDVTDMDLAHRKMVASHGGTWLADSPRGLAQVMGDLASTGVIGVIGEHFGERPYISLQKCTLRRNEPVYNLTGWHQDGSFMGENARAMNVWIALTDCGGDIPTPGLELVPGRVDEILPRDGGLGTASIADATVLAASRGLGTTRPEFAAGDALMFDGYFVHRTHLAPDMVNARYALESWFFAGSSPAAKYQSFLI